MVEDETHPSSQVTLVGLGPPVARAADALGEPRHASPETIRPWTLSDSAEDDAPRDIPLSPLVPQWPPALVPSRGAVRAIATAAAIVGAGVLGVGLGRGPLARTPVVPSAGRSALAARPPLPDVSRPVPVAAPSAADRTSPETETVRPRREHAQRAVAREPRAARPPAEDPVRVRSIADSVELDDDPEGNATPEAPPPVAAPADSALPAP